ncbi:MAG: hypothetical protein IJ193_05335, partial [Bacilli bacterium]|nr:hypothetical protein [Bacilli bacterium]
MQKKVRILMVLLCLFLFPLRVFALEEAIAGTEYNQGNDDVAEINTTVPVESTDEVVATTDNEELSADEATNEDSNLENTDEVNTDVSSNEETDSEFDYSQIEGEVHAFDPESDSVIGIDKINITGANFDVKAGAKPTYTGKVAEEDQDKYSLAYEAWFGSNYSIYYNYSDSSRNDETSFETFEKMNCYYYEFAILVKDGYKLNFNYKEDNTYSIPVSINGTDYNLYDIDREEVDGGTIYSFIPNISRVSEVENGETIDSIIINDVNANITVGKAPTY